MKHTRLHPYARRENENDDENVLESAVSDSEPTIWSCVNDVKMLFSTIKDSVVDILTPSWLADFLDQLHITPPLEISRTPPSEIHITPPTGFNITPTNTLITPQTGFHITPTNTHIIPHTENHITPPSEIRISPPTEFHITPPTEAHITPTEFHISPPTNTHITPHTENHITPPTNTHRTPPNYTYRTPTEANKTPPSEDHRTPPNRTPPTKTQQDNITAQNERQREGQTTTLFLQGERSRFPNEDSTRDDEVQGHCNMMKLLNLEDGRRLSWKQQQPMTKISGNRFKTCDVNFEIWNSNYVARQPKEFWGNNSCEYKQKHYYSEEYAKHRKRQKKIERQKSYELINRELKDITYRYEQTQSFTSNTSSDLYSFHDETAKKLHIEQRSSDQTRNRVDTDATSRRFCDVLNRDHKPLFTMIPDLQTDQSAPKLKLYVPDVSRKKPQKIMPKDANVTSINESLPVKENGSKQLKPLLKTQQLLSKEDCLQEILPPSCNEGPKTSSKTSLEFQFTTPSSVSSINQDIITSNSILLASVPSTIPLFSTKSEVCLTSQPFQSKPVISTVSNTSFTTNGFQCKSQTLKQELPSDPGLGNSDATENKFPFKQSYETLSFRNNSEPITKLGTSKCYPAQPPIHVLNSNQDFQTTSSSSFLVPTQPRILATTSSSFTNTCSMKNQFLSQPSSLLDTRNRQIGFSMSSNTIASFKDISQGQSVGQNVIPVTLNSKSKESSIFKGSTTSATSSSLSCNWTLTPKDDTSFVQNADIKPDQSFPDFSCDNFTTLSTKNNLPSASLASSAKTFRYSSDKSDHYEQSFISEHAFERDASISKPQCDNISSNHTAVQPVSSKINSDNIECVDVIKCFKGSIDEPLTSELSDRALSVHSRMISTNSSTDAIDVNDQSVDVTHTHAVQIVSCGTRQPMQENKDDTNHNASEFRLASGDDNAPLESLSVMDVPPMATDESTKSESFKILDAHFGCPIKNLQSSGTGDGIKQLAENCLNISNGTQGNAFIDHPSCAVNGSTMLRVKEDDVRKTNILKTVQRTVNGSTSRRSKIRRIPDITNMQVDTCKAMPLNCQTVVGRTSLKKPSPSTQITSNEILVLPEPICSPTVEHISESVNFKQVFCDIETTSLSLEYGEIVQIAAVCEEEEFDQYILPLRRFDREASKVTGLTCDGEVLYHNGSAVRTTDLRSALLQFLGWLDSFKLCVLVGHNFKLFDYPRIYRALKNANLVNSFHQIVVGFVDSLPLFKVLYPNLKSYKQESLVAKFVGESYDAHNALGDVKGLQKVFRKSDKITRGLLCEHSYTVTWFVHYHNYKANCKEIAETYREIIADKILGKSTVDKIAGNGLSLEDLKLIYGRGPGDFSQVMKSRLKLSKSTVDKLVKFLTAKESVST